MMIKMLWNRMRNGTTWLQIGILAVLLIGMLAVWPVCLIWQEVYSSPGVGNYGISEELEPGMSFTQSFRAESDYLISLDFALDFDDTQPHEGILGFEFLDADGQLIYDGIIPYGSISRQTFFPIEVERRLKKGEVYQYRITNQDITANLPSVIYTVEEELHTPDNCGYFIEEEEQQGESLSRYLWKKPYDAVTILNIWAFMGMAAFLCCEICKSIGGSHETD